MKARDNEHLRTALMRAEERLMPFTRSSKDLAKTVDHWLSKQLEEFPQQIDFFMSKYNISEYEPRRTETPVFVDPSLDYYQVAKEMFGPLSPDLERSLCAKYRKMDRDRPAYFIWVGHAFNYREGKDQQKVMVKSFSERLPRRLKLMYDIFYCHPYFLRGLTINEGLCLTVQLPGAILTYPPGFVTLFGEPIISEKQAYLAFYREIYPDHNEITLSEHWDIRDVNHFPFTIEKR